MSYTVLGTSARIEWENYWLWGEVVTLEVALLIAKGPSWILFPLPVTWYCKQDQWIKAGWQVRHISFTYVLQITVLEGTSGNHLLQSPATASSLQQIVQENIQAGSEYLQWRFHDLWADCSRHHGLLNVFYWKHQLSYPQDCPEFSVTVK